MENIKFRTDKERRSFLDAYHSWKVFHTIDELGVTIYAAHLNTGATIYATDYLYQSFDKLLKHGVIYSLVLDSRDESFYDPVFYKYYKPTGCGITMIMNYLKSNKGCEVIISEV